MVDYLRKPPVGSVERDNYEAEKRRQRARRCACGNRLHATDTQCTPCRRPLPSITLTPAQTEEAERYWSKPSERKHKGSVP